MVLGVSNRCEHIDSDIDERRDHPATSKPVRSIFKVSPLVLIFGGLAGAAHHHRALASSHSFGVIMYVGPE